MSSSAKVIASLIAGLAAGTALGILMAPAEGRQSANPCVIPSENSGIRSLAQLTADFTGLPIGDAAYLASSKHNSWLLNPKCPMIWNTVKFLIYIPSHNITNNLFFGLTSLKSLHPLKKILIVEDDPDILDLIETILRLEGYAVIRINRPVPIKEVIGIKPDLVILDYLLPYGPGSDLCLEIKTNPVTRTIPVILFSASLSLAEIASASGADDFIAKPFDLDQFLGLVSRWINK
jgi:CheY-like chemotaxis protein